MATSSTNPGKRGNATEQEVRETPKKRLRMQEVEKELIGVVEDNSWAAREGFDGFDDVKGLISRRKLRKPNLKYEAEKRLELVRKEGDGLERDEVLSDLKKALCRCAEGEESNKAIIVQLQSKLTKSQNAHEQTYKQGLAVTTRLRAERDTAKQEITRLNDAAYSKDGEIKTLQQAVATKEGQLVSKATDSERVQREPEQQLRENRKRLLLYQKVKDERPDSELEDDDCHANTAMVQFASEQGVDVSTAEQSPNPKPSMVEVAKMFHYREGKAKMEVSRWDVFETITAVVTHAKSNTVACLPLRDRAALWNIWQALEKDAGEKLREAVGRGILSMAREVILGIKKRPGDGMTLWLTSHLVSHLSRYAIGTDLPALDDVGSEEHVLTFLAVREFTVASQAPVQPLISYVNDLAMGTTGSVQKFRYFHGQEEWSLALFDLHGEIAVMSVAPQGEWWVCFVREKDCFLCFWSPSLYLLLNVGGTQSARVLLLDEDECEEIRRTKKGLFARLEILDENDERVLGMKGKGGLE